MTPDREPTRDEKHRAVVTGLLAAKQGRGYMDCPWRIDGGPWESVMRSCWVEGWTDGNADRVAFE